MLSPSPLICPKVYFSFLYGCFSSLLRLAELSCCSFLIRKKVTTDLHSLQSSEKVLKEVCWCLEHQNGSRSISLFCQGPPHQPFMSLLKICGQVKPLPVREVSSTLWSLHINSFVHNIQGRFVIGAMEEELCFWHWVLSLLQVIVEQLNFCNVVVHVTHRWRYN